MEATPTVQVEAYVETPENQIAKLQLEGNSIVKLEEQAAMDTISYAQNCDILDKHIQVAVNRFKLNEENKEVQEGVRSKLLEIQQALELKRTKFASITSAIRLQAKSLADLLVRYESFTSGQTELEWNKYITKVEKDALKKCIGDGADLVKMTRKMREEFVKLLHDVNTLMQSLTYVGKSEIDQTEIIIQTCQDDITKTIEDIEGARNGLLEFDQSLREMQGEEKEQQFQLDMLKNALKNQEAALANGQSNLTAINDEIAAQQKALSDSLAEAKKDFAGSLTSANEIKKMFKDTITTARSKIHEHHLSLIQMDCTLEETSSTTITTTTKTSGSSKRAGIHYIVLQDESGSMSGGNWGGKSCWAKSMEYIMDFCKSDSIGEYDLLSIVGYSHPQPPVVRANALTKSQAANLKEWSPMYCGERIAPALELAHSLAKQHPKYRTVYIGLTDGAIPDYHESLRKCEEIRASAPKDMAKPVMFFIGLGSAASSAQLTALLKALNDAIYLAGPDGQKICDLLVTADQKSSAGMTVVQTLFLETIKTIETKSAEQIKLEITRLEGIISNLEQKQKIACESGAKSDAQLDEITKATEARFEECHLKPLRERHAIAEEDIKTLQQVVFDEGKKVVAQEGVVQKDTQRIAHQQERIVDETARLEALKQKKIDLNQKVTVQLQKKQEQTDAFQAQSGEDKNIAGMIALKYQLSQSTHKLTNALNFVSEMQEFITQIVSGEENMHNSIYYGFTVVGIKSSLIKRLMNNESAFTPESAKNLLDLEDDSRQGKKAHDNLLNSLLNQKFTERDINKFDNSDWTWAKLCEYFNYSDREIEALFGIMKSCTFDELCKGLRDRDNDDKEKKTFEELKQKVEKFWRHQLNLDEAKLTALKNKIKTDVKRIESIDEELAEEAKLCDKHTANITTCKKKGGKLFIAAIKKKSEDTIKAQEKLLKVLQEELEVAYNNLQESKAAQQAKLKKKQAEECADKEIEAIKDKIELIELEGDEEIEKLKGKIDAAHELIIEASMDIQGADAPEKILQRAEAKLVKTENKIKELEEEQETLNLIKKESKRKLELLQEKVDAERVAIDGDLSTAGFILNQVRDLCFNNYQEDTRKQFKQQINELIRQIKAIIEPLLAFYNEDKRKALEGAGVKELQSRAIEM